MPRKKVIKIVDKETGDRIRGLKNVRDINRRKTPWNKNLCHYSPFVTSRLVTKNINGVNTHYLKEEDELGRYVLLSSGLGLCTVFDMKIIVRLMTVFRNNEKSKLVFKNMKQLRETLALENVDCNTIMDSIMRLCNMVINFKNAFYAGTAYDDKEKKVVKYYKTAVFKLLGGFWGENNLYIKGKRKERETFDDNSYTDIELFLDPVFIDKTNFLEAKRENGYYTWLFLDEINSLDKSPLSMKHYLRFKAFIDSDNGLKNIKMLDMNYDTVKQRFGISDTSDKYALVKHHNKALLSAASAIKVKTDENTGEHRSVAWLDTELKDKKLCFKKH